MAGERATHDGVDPGKPGPKRTSADEKRWRPKLRGTWNYYGLIGNYRRLRLFYEVTCRTVYKWLGRRSQRKRMTWPAFERMLARFRVPPPRIVEKRQERMPCQMELSFCQRLMGFLKPRASQAAHASVS